MTPSTARHGDESLPSGAQFTTSAIPADGDIVCDSQLAVGSKHGQSRCLALLYSVRVGREAVAVVIDGAVILNLSNNTATADYQRKRKYKTRSSHWRDYTQLQMTLPP